MIWTPSEFRSYILFIELAKKECPDKILNVEKKLGNIWHRVDDINGNIASMNNVIVKYGDDIFEDIERVYEGIKAEISKDASFITFKDALKEMSVYFNDIEHTEMCSMFRQITTNWGTLAFIVMNMIDKVHEHIITKKLMIQWLSIPGSERESFVTQLKHAVKNWIHIDKIKEDKWEDILPTEAPAGAELDKYAFASHRRGTTPHEPDNKFERELYFSFYSAFVNSASLSLDDIEAIQSFIDNGEYKKMFHAPTCESIYRAMSVKHDFFKKIFNNVGTINDHGDVKGSFTFSPLRTRNTSSWTKNLKFAENFNNTYSDFNVIMYASVVNNDANLLDCEGLYDAGFSEFRNEHEVIAFGNVHVNRVVWRKNEVDED